MPVGSSDHVRLAADDLRAARDLVLLSDERTPVADRELAAPDPNRGNVLRPAAVDRRVLTSLAEDLGDGGADIVADLVVTYLSDTGRAVTELLDAVASGDLAAVAEVAHRIQSSTALLGAAALADLLGRVVSAARGNRVVADLGALIDDEFRRVVFELSEFDPTAT